MNAKNLQTAAVLGAGTMGNGIAQVLAMTGITTRLYDIAPGQVERGLANVKTNLDKGVAKGKVAQGDMDAALKRLSGTTNLKEAIAGVDCVVEAVPEKLELKQTLFQELGNALGADVLLATNTSSLSITRIASVTKHSERGVGMHSFNPVHIMKLVEVGETERSSAAAVACALELARRMGKDPIRVKDFPGFASSRLGVLVGLEAMRMVESGVASAADIDKAMTLGYGFPMGPLELTDLVGLDVRMSIAEYLSKELGARFDVPPILKEKVQRGELGKKSGKGFYEWKDGAALR
ncbi:MAG: 3-hydroxyacyl-CoA dehydrogenase family protein [Planctomycetes bacterium]|nr:3-hydroxyacyl-CoA dehydrogenase family protein [Planctomycetota bacterium]